MGVQQALTTEQVSILLWLKTIDDFKGEGYETATFNEKYDAFEAVEDTGFTREEYDSYVGFWKRNGIIDEDQRSDFVSSDSNRFYLVHDCTWCGDGIFL